MSLLKWFSDKWPLVWKKTWRWQYNCCVNQGIRIARLETDNTSYEVEVESLKERVKDLLAAKDEIIRQRDIFAMAKDLNGFVLVDSKSPSFYLYTTETGYEGTRILLKTLSCQIAIAGHDVPRDQFAEWLEGKFKDEFMKFATEHKII